MKSGPPVVQMTRSFLDQQRCGEPGCTKPHGTPLVMSGQCHVGAPVGAECWPQFIRIACACGVPIGDISVASYLRLPRQPCHDQAVKVTYDRGTLVVQCFTCEATVTEAAVGEELFR